MCLQLIGLTLRCSLCATTMHNLGRPLYNFARIASSKKLSHGFSFKTDHLFPDCLLQFIVWGKYKHSKPFRFTSRRHRGHCRRGKRSRAFSTDPSRKLRATYARKHIKGSHPTTSVTLCLTFTESWFYLITLMDDRFSLSGSGQSNHVKEFMGKYCPHIAHNH